MVLHYTHITTGTARKAVEVLDAEPILAPAITQPEPAVQSWFSDRLGRMKPFCGHMKKRPRGRFLCY